jgi:hypothetical protein
MSWAESFMHTKNQRCNGTPPPGAATFGSRGQRLTKSLRGAASRALQPIGAAILLLALTSCGPQAGAWLYFFGPKHTVTVKAKCKLTQGPLLILMDESPALDLPPDLEPRLVRAVRDEFERTGINKKAIDPNRVAELRRQHEDFHRRGIREVGRMVDAEQVLWIYPREIALAQRPEEATDPARLSVALKVINAQAETADELRVWPVSDEGEIVTIEIDPHEMQQIKSTDELMRRLTNRMALHISQLFRDYDPEKEPDV